MERTEEKKRGDIERSIRFSSNLSTSTSSLSLLPLSPLLPRTTNEKKKPTKSQNSEPQYYDRIALLGRDAEEVFPNRSRAAAASAADAAAAALGARRFVSEKELDELKATMDPSSSAAATAGAHPEGSSSKPLAEVLRERAAAKAAAVEETWRQMKVGVNRPLDEDEVEFVNGALDAEERAAREAVRKEEEEMRAFSEAVKRSRVTRARGEGGEEKEAAAVSAEATATAAAAATTAKAPRPAAVAFIKPPASKLGGTLVVRAKKKKKKEKEEDDEDEEEGERKGGGGGGGEEAALPPQKRRKAEEGDEKSDDEEDKEGGNGLAGLLGGYGSDDSG